MTTLSAESIFLKLLNMSYTGAIVILVIILARLILKKAPRRFSYALWAIALIRLLCPFSFESALSLMPENTEPVPADIAYQAAPGIETGIPFVNDAVSSVLPAAEPASGANPMQIVLAAAALVWLLGVSALFAYAVISYLRLRRRLATSVTLTRGVRLTDAVSSPFVLGVIRPKIYLPSSLTELDREYVLMHERTHIRRGDHIIRILSYIALCLHWFNPLVWAAFILSGRDMELSCDEAVIRKSREDIRAEYSSLLLGLATGRRVFSATPLAFGEGDTGGRVRNVLSFKKPAVWAVVLSFALIAALCLTLLTNPASDSDGSAPFGARYGVTEVAYASPLMSTLYLDGSAPEFCLTSDYGLFRKDAGGRDWAYAGGFAEADMSRDDFVALFMEAFYDAGQAYDGNGKMWRLDIGDSFYLLLRQKDGSVLIAECATANAASGEYSYVRYLFAIEAFSGEADWDYLTLSLTERISFYSQTDYSVSVFSVYEQDGCIIAGFTCRDSSVPGHNGVGSAVFTCFDGRYELLDSPSRTSAGLLDNNGVYVDCHELDKHGVDAIFDVALFTGGDIARADWTRGEADGGLSIDASPAMLVLERPRGASADELELTLYDSGGNIVGVYNAGDGYMDVPRRTAGAPDQDGGDWVEAEISAAILGQNEGRYASGDLAAEAHTILGIEEETKGYLTMYVMAMYQEFSFSGGKLTVTGGSHMPVAIVFETTGENYYNLVEYWTPWDGADYAASIRERFPADIAKKAIDTQLYVTGHMISCYAQAVQYGGADTAGVIAGLIEEICSSPAEASSPYAYISAHDVEYRELVWYGASTLDYCYKLFDEGGQTGLEGHVMAAACYDICAALGRDTVPTDGFATGQDWYEAHLYANAAADVD